MLNYFHHMSSFVHMAPPNAVMAYVSLPLSHFQNYIVHIKIQAYISEIQFALFPY